MNTSEKGSGYVIHEDRNSRRSFVRRMGLAGAGLGAFLASVDSSKAQTTDADLIQFALNLEYLEAEFYTVALTGKTIDQLNVGIAGTGTAGATTGGKQVTFITGSTLALSAAETAANERAHVSLLRAALNNGGTVPIAKPAINLNALGSGFGSQEEFIALARSLEDVVVSAYCSLLPVLQNKAYLAIAVRLLAAEGEHAANLRLHAALYNVATTAVDAADILPPPSGTQFFSADNSYGLTTVRTPGQVLYAAYGQQANQTSGGFFPAGTNGIFNASSSAATPLL